MICCTGSSPSRKPSNSARQDAFGDSCFLRFLYSWFSIIRKRWLVRSRLNHSIRWYPKMIITTEMNRREKPDGRKITDPWWEIKQYVYHRIITELRSMVHGSDTSAYVNLQWSWLCRSEHYHAAQRSIPGGSSDYRCSWYQLCRTFLFCWHVAETYRGT